jgi:hypothetical protein
MGKTWVDLCFFLLLLASGYLLMHPESPLLPFRHVFGEQGGCFLFLFGHLSSMSGGHDFSLCCGVGRGSPSWRNGAIL